MRLLMIADVKENVMRQTGKNETVTIIAINCLLLQEFWMIVLHCLQSLTRSDYQRTTQNTKGHLKFNLFDLLSIILLPNLTICRNLNYKQNAVDNPNNTATLEFSKCFSA